MHVLQHNKQYRIKELVSSFYLHRQGFIHRYCIRDRTTLYNACQTVTCKLRCLFRLHYFLQEISISKRFALKESQNQLIQNLIKDAKLNEEQANAIMKNHLANMAAIDKATDEERARRVMALEMRLAERRALAKQKVYEEAKLA